MKYRILSTLVAVISSVVLVGNASAANQTLTVTKTGTGTGTVLSSPAGINCGSICSASFSKNSIVILTATPDSGSTFTGWGGSCTGTSTCKIRLNQNKTVTAGFNLPAPTVPVVTSNIHDLDTVINGTVWNVSYDQAVTSTEFWANGALLSTDSAAPYSQTISLPVGADRLGLVVNVGGNRYVYGINGSCVNCGGTFANITVQDPPPPPPPPGCNGCYLYEPLDGSITQPPWLFSVSSPQGGDPSASFSWISDGVSGQALRYHIPASSTPDIGSSQLISHFLGNGSQYVHTAPGETTWYRNRVRFPSGTNFPSGEWDYVVEWHKDATIVSGGDSIAWETYSPTQPLDPNVPGANPEFEFETYGGIDSAPTNRIWRTAPNFIVPGHWYDLVAEITWGVDSTVGAVSLWIDGQPFPGVTWPQHVPTLMYSATTGQVDQPAYGIYSYHYKTGYATDRDHDEVLIGPTASSVGFTL